MNLLFVWVYLVISLVLLIITVVIARYMAIKNSLALIPTDISEQILENAKIRKNVIYEEVLFTTRFHLEKEAKRLADDHDTVLQIQKGFEQNLAQKQSELDKKGNVLSQATTILGTKRVAVSEKKQALNNLNVKLQNINSKIILELEQKSAITSTELKNILAKEIFEVEQLFLTKQLYENIEYTKEHSDKISNEVLNIVVSRYSPKFLWPKNAFIIETPSKEFATEFFVNNAKMLQVLVEHTGITVELIEQENNTPPVLKLSGGSGPDKEILRLALEEIQSKCILDIDKACVIRDKFKKQIDKTIIKLGHEAVKIVGINTPINEEILKLIGSLNYRTSHRQNQYWHSIEVSILAGLIASEIGVDKQLAKRVGLLHDIGKALDYKIEGSHAIISADYAQIYGENNEIVDTVYSHHDDKVVDTPLAFILKAADALSGGRPGARVEMEDGYHNRIDLINEVIKSFEKQGVINSAIMHAGREIHVFLDHNKVKDKDMDNLSTLIVKKLEAEVEYPGQIKITLIRRIEVSEVV